MDRNKSWWTPVRDGDTYCSPACGRGCSWAAHEQAHKNARALCAKLSKGDLEWEPRIWENLGWHYAARSKCGRFEVQEHKFDLGGPWSYHAFLNTPGDLPGGKWVGSAETGLESIEDARRKCREHLEKYAPCIDLKLVPAAEG